MESIQNFLNFLHYTFFKSSSGTIVYGGSIGGGYIGGGAVARKVAETGATDSFLCCILPYVPLIGIGVALLKLAIDFYKWKVERNDRKIRIQAENYQRIKTNLE